jgi:hypothetical protein
VTFQGFAGRKISVVGFFMRNDRDWPSPAVLDPAERIDIAPDPNVRDEPSLRGLAPHRDGAGERRGFIAAGVFGWLGHGG